jgi:hypothetical protein
MRTPLLALLALALLAAAPAASGDGGPSPGAVTGWDGVLSPTGHVRYTALTAAGSTVVAAVEVGGGRVLQYRTLRGLYGIPLVANDGTTGGLSADATTLVLAPFGGPVQAGQVSRFAVLTPDRSFKIRRLVTLRGAFSFDAISPTGRVLYLIEYLQQSGAAVTYRVRAYDVARGKLVRGSIVDRREPDERMQGSPVTRASSRDGVWAYTLYARPAGKPFVHALDTRRAQAFCIDLPWQADQSALQNVKMTAGAGRLVIHDGAGRLASVDTRSWKVKSYRRP